MLKSRGLIISWFEVENSYQPDSGDVVFWKRKLIRSRVPLSEIPSFTICLKKLLAKKT
ncbi:hypothetical protein D3C77_692250 [compost metagenome]